MAVAFPPSLYGVPCSTLRIATVSPQSVLACASLVLGTTTRRQHPVCVTVVRDHNNVLLALSPLPPAAPPLPPSDNAATAPLSGEGLQPHAVTGRCAPVGVVRLPLGAWIPESVALTATDHADTQTVVVAVVAAHDRRATYLRAVGIVVVHVTRVDAAPPDVAAEALEVRAVDWFPLQPDGCFPDGDDSAGLERHCTQIHAQVLPDMDGAATSKQPTRARLLVTLLDTVTSLADRECGGTRTPAARPADKKRQHCIRVLSGLMEPRCDRRFSVVSHGWTDALTFHEAFLTLARNHHWTDKLSVSPVVTAIHKGEGSSSITSSGSSGGGGRACDASTGTWYSHILVHEMRADEDSARCSALRIELLGLPPCREGVLPHRQRLTLSCAADACRTPLHLSSAAPQQLPAKRHVSFASFPELPAALVVIEEPALCVRAKRMRGDDDVDTETVPDAVRSKGSCISHSALQMVPSCVQPSGDDEDSARRPVSEAIRLELPQWSVVRDVGIVPARTVGGQHLVAALVADCSAAKTSPHSLLVWQSPFEEWDPKGTRTTMCSKAVPYDLLSFSRRGDEGRCVLDACIARHTVGSSATPPWLGTVVVVMLVLKAPA